MQKILIIVLIITLYSCRHETKKTTKIEAISVKKDSIEEEIDAENKINDSVYCLKKSNNEGYFYMYYSKDENENISFDSIKIENKFDKKIQKIKFKKDYFLSSWQADFWLEDDVNFDGFKDLKIINYNGLYNTQYSFWIYKNKDHIYKHAFALDSIYNPGFDATKKEIYSEWRVALESFHYETYFWKNNKLILKEERIEDLTNNSDSIHVFTKKLVGGKYIEKEVNVKQ
ncbi:XAC2610-related protein [Flavobacterium sp.]|uniref:XAC2610-related protein n=1 Tax=Flavobacterium sp. TaxID=239 RepID=UPI00375173D5